MLPDLIPEEILAQNLSFFSNIASTDPVVWYLSTVRKLERGRVYFAVNGKIAFRSISP